MSISVQRAAATKVGGVCACGERGGTCVRVCGGGKSGGCWASQQQQQSVQATACGRRCHGTDASNSVFAPWLPSQHGANGSTRHARLRPFLCVCRRPALLRRLPLGLPPALLRPGRGAARCAAGEAAGGLRDAHLWLACPASLQIVGADTAATLPLLSGLLQGAGSAPCALTARPPMAPLGSATGSAPQPRPALALGALQTAAVAVAGCSSGRRHAVAAAWPGSSSSSSSRRRQRRGSLVEAGATGVTGGNEGGHTPSFDAL